MTKFSGTTRKPVRANARGFVQTTDEQIPTFEGADARARTAESDLFLLAVTNMVGEDTFYETAGDRDKRYVDLIHEVTKKDPGFILGRDPETGHVGFARYLRETMLMRSASVVLACEYVAAGGPFGRQVIDAVCQRPDEPAEVLGYWLAEHGRAIPQPVKRGLADAVRRLYTERAVLRNDGLSRGIRMADVIELVHPTPVAPWQDALFKYLLDRRHHDAGTADPAVLKTLAKARELDRLDGDALLARLREEGPELLDEAGYSWERLSGKTKMTAEAWSLILPSMGVMALVRNLRNFDEQGIPEDAIEKVIDRITDADEVAKARLFPYQVWSAYKNAPSDNWKRALGKTLDLTTKNIPAALDGSVIAVDCSGSMRAPMSGRSKLNRYEVAAVMAAATAKGTKNTDVVCFGDTYKVLSIPAGTSALKVVQEVERITTTNEVGSSTYGHSAVRATFDPAKHKRAIIFTDDQMWDSVEPGAETSQFVRSGYGRATGADISHVPLVYTFNLAGYAPSALPSGQRGRYTLGGFTDATFRAMEVLEAGKDAHWPF